MNRWPGLAIMLLAACGSPAVTEVDTAPETGWAAIQARGAIRLAGRAWEGFDTLPSRGLSAERYRELAEQFAARHSLAVEWHTASSILDMLTLVAAGQADIGVANITVTAQRARDVSFSLPLTRSQEWVVGVPAPTSFGVAVGTAYEHTLAAEYPDAPRVPVPPDADPQAFIDLIEQGVVDATIMDEAAARVVVRVSDRIEKLRVLPAVQEHAWALPPDTPTLKAKLDEFLLERHVFDEADEAPRDWPAIKASGRLRMLTVNAPTTYYLWRGELLGYEYELAGGFAAQHGLALEVVVAGDFGELFTALASGKGDFIAAGVNSTPEREARGFRFTTGYMPVRETFVTAGTPVTALADLAGRVVTVHPATSYAATLASLGDDVDFEVAFREAATQSLLEAVATGALDVTLADSHRAELAATFHPDLQLGWALERKELAWAVRGGSVELLEHLNAYIAAGYRGYEFNVLRNKYFKNQRRMFRQREHRVTGTALSAYDPVIKPLAEAADLDWRLVVAQMYQESGFDPATVSFAGARGLLQVMPRTAEQLGVDPVRLHEPDVGIRAGIGYLAWTRERFPDLPVGEQIKFALAAYNAGAGHVRDGRRLARRLGLDGSLWFDNVETALLKLAEPEHARQALHGYVRGSEVVNYVRDIHDRYRAYLDHFRVLQLGPEEQAPAPAGDRSDDAEGPA